MTSYIGKISIIWSLKVTFLGYLFRKLRASTMCIAPSGTLYIYLKRKTRKFIFTASPRALSDILSMTPTVLWEVDTGLSTPVRKRRLKGVTSFD